MEDMAYCGRKSDLEGGAELFAVSGSWCQKNFKTVYFICSNTKICTYIVWKVAILNPENNLKNILILSDNGFLRTMPFYKLFSLKTLKLPRFLTVFRLYLFKIELKRESINILIKMTHREFGNINSSQF